MADLTVKYRYARTPVSKFSKAANDVWSKKVADYEPVTSLGPWNACYKMVGEELVADRIAEGRGQSKHSWSALLFGPPGTGKTTVAENVAETLRLPLITVTVSDFLADGAQVEARAKAIFEVLNRQTGAVVLFDEIDQLLLDRESELYREQESSFQFLTPGMLTKINDLRKIEKVIFFLATNYIDHIDPAIKRRGRIDRQIIVLPPDRDGREKIVSKIFSDNGVKLPKNIDRILSASFLLNFNDMNAIITYHLRKGLPLRRAVAGIVDELGGAERVARLSAYEERLKSEHAPLREYLCLLAMHFEEGSSDVAHASLEDAIGATAALAERLQLGSGGMAAKVGRLLRGGGSEREADAAAGERMREITSFVEDVVRQAAPEPSAGSGR